MALKTPIATYEISVRDSTGLIDTHKLDVSLSDLSVEFLDPCFVGLSVEQMLERVSAIRTPGVLGWTWETPTRENFDKVLQHHLTKAQKFNRFRDGQRFNRLRDGRAL